MRLSNATPRRCWRSSRHARGLVVNPPIPIEDIIEKHLKLRLDFDDLHELLGVPQAGPEPDIFGAIWVERREICIDQSLDPEEWPRIEGRYRFTLAHEGGGHWRLHREYLARDPNQASLFADHAQPAIVCRSSQSKERVEWQADFYASCLLMPRALVVEAWQKRFGNANPCILRRKNRMSVDRIDDPDMRAAVDKFECNQDKQALQDFVRPFAEQFQSFPDRHAYPAGKTGASAPRDTAPEPPCWGRLMGFLLRRSSSVN